MPRDTLVRGLSGSYNEQSVAFGVSVDGMLLEVFASPAGSFTVVKTGPQGRACIVDAGHAWQMATPDVDREQDAGPGLRPGL
jgi:hypothetical protein